MINRKITEEIKKRIGLGKAIVIIGARQVGKTTLLKSLVEGMSGRVLWLNGDESDIREIFSNITSTRLKAIIGDKSLLIIDEAQRINNVGLTIKLIVDNLPGVQVIVTGSSALEISDKLKEPLTGRKFEFVLYPIAFSESVENSSLIEAKRLLEHRLIFGSYPEIITHPGSEIELLNLLSESYLYKDLLQFENIKKPAALDNLLLALALQIGNEVSYNELGQLIGLNQVTVEKYVDLLEKAFVIFRLTSLSRNKRNEIKKGRKIYFFDNGIRNAIIKNFNPLKLRQDIGALWENFIVSERIKTNHYSKRYVNSYFWRTHSQQEIDYIEEYGGKIYAYEIKWNPSRKVKFPESFFKSYPNSEKHLITPANFEDFLL
ncbi:MAG: ATP-binding protein [Bacteroidetes bacterium]|nr:ATP-binding protein [Bacteroidota bacterium]MBU1679005.1 ATP-binding protein [Bacteroidota bacterium]MBU2505298.1 ATP-binding protein [Bacteroidota bacterium]